ncbi:MAG: sulfite exporter TauE/SafE family protein [Bacteroidetes bacterium]|nr:MAG: sulfite exporter TauE/SafE family protein [Bacteroidota bacterium]REK05277.1 MAG: sulfite exporter TauE/SafE family protein [Bacteroidota bacterium]REK32682.1 MAG: sulfite exporter TauE/SafE family protein [Bacteroidota bacterium]REK48871.1 MAG: sulfite exporter TauE/SafE family protein [Bacteroidota bacterium]
MVLMTAFALGFLGSAHCIGMCGPIAVMLPGRDSSWFVLISGRLLYNAGRISTYVIMGLAAGLIGFTFSMNGFQKWLSVLTGCGLILSVSIPLVNSKFRISFSAITKLTVYIKGAFKRVFKFKSPLSLFLTGTVTGLLPCGLVYVAMAAAVAMGSISNSSLYMLSFGLGTLPVMFATSISHKLFGGKIVSSFRNLYPVLIIVLGIFLIYRGISMNSASCCH